MRIQLLLLALGIVASVPISHAVTNPVVACPTTTLYATVTDPIKLTFAPDGTVCVGRDHRRGTVFPSDQSMNPLTNHEPPMSTRKASASRCGSTPFRAWNVFDSKSMPSRQRRSPTRTGGTSNHPPGSRIHL